ncbi:MAG: hypothetical protein ACNA7W_08130 [Pseudomonadales bacterium]
MQNLDNAKGLMLRFAERTRIGARTGGQRYLWTDAFAVCNFLGLAEAGGEAALRDTALTLIDDVHRTLGRHRPDEPHPGWLSGLPEAVGEQHPTRGGLRIGKPLPERAPGEPLDRDLEWERDGQYFHYLTRWMHALDQTAWATGDPTFNRWARELAEVAFRTFTYEARPGRARRMHWKMSIDLTRPLVPAMGHHDPLDGYVTLLQLDSSARLFERSPDRDPALWERSPDRDRGPDLGGAIDAFAAMLVDADWTTDDALGLGGLLMDAHRVHQLETLGTAVAPQLLRQLLAGAQAGLAQLLRQAPWLMPAGRRLAFRELGLALGLQAVQALRHSLADDAAVEQRGLRGPLETLTTERALAEHLVTFWSTAESQRSPMWGAHRDINEVMLATALAPAGYLELGSSSHHREAPWKRDG